MNRFFSVKVTGDKIQNPCYVQKCIQVPVRVDANKMSSLCYPGQCFTAELH